MSSDYVIQLEKCSKTTLSPPYRLRFYPKIFTTGNPVYRSQHVYIMSNHIHIFSYLNNGQLENFGKISEI